MIWMVYRFKCKYEYICIYIYVYARYTCIFLGMSKHIQQESINSFAWTLLPPPICPVANFWPGCSSKPGIKFSWVPSELNKIIYRPKRLWLIKQDTCEKVKEICYDGQGFLKAPNILHANHKAFVYQKMHDKGYWIKNIKNTTRYGLVKQ